MGIFFNKKVIVRCCVGCILPHKSKLVGTGEIEIGNPIKKIEKFYDYIINEKDLLFFINTNRKILLENNLLDEINDPEEKL